MENPRAEEFEHTMFIKETYRPACASFQGEGAEKSRILCGKPEDEAARLALTRPCRTESVMTVMKHRLELDIEVDGGLDYRAP